MKRTSAVWEGLDPAIKSIIESHQVEIPVKVGQLARDLGLLVKVATLEVGISGSIEPYSESEAGFKITINKHEPKYRQRFTLAHEIAHYLLHKDLIGMGLKDNVLYRSNLSDAKEAEANALASDIIMPRDKLKEWILISDYDKPADYICDIATEFGVSEEAMRISLGLK